MNHYRRTKKKGNSTGIFFLAFLCLFFTLQSVNALPNGTETIITTDTTGSFQQNPAIFNDLLTWDDQRAGPGMNIIYAYNLTGGNEYAVLPDPANPMLWQTAPSISGDWIVWQQDDFTSYTIIAFNNASLEYLSIPAIPRDTGGPSYLIEPADNVLPKTNGTVVVWQDYSNNPHWGINLYNLAMGSGGSAEPLIANPSYDQKSPAISGEAIVYENWSGGQSDIYRYFGVNRTAVRISQFSNDDLNPSIDGTRVVWQRYNDTTGFDAVYWYDAVTGETRQVTPAGSPFSQAKPEISGSLVVVEDSRVPGAKQVYIYDLATSPPAEQWVTPASARMKFNPAVSGNRIVWEDYRTGNGDDSDIYLNTLGLPAEQCPNADFTASPLSVNQGDVVSFSAAGPQAGASAISHMLWNFSDGSPWIVSTASATSHQYSENAVFPVKLTVENLKCRNVSVNTCNHKVFVNSPPVPDFTATPAYGLSPLTVRFADTSCGAPLTWTWDFGDGNVSPVANPSNIFYQPGREFSVTLTINNTRAGSAPASVTKKVRTLMGGQDTATLPVDGIAVATLPGGGFLTFNSNAVPHYSPEPPAPYLAVYPPQDYGWDNITFMTADSIGIGPASPNSTYFGNVSRIYLKTRDVIATTVATPPEIGNNWGASYLINTTASPRTASLKTAIWEGAIPPDRADFDYIASHAAVPALIRSIAYTARITKQGFDQEGEEKINMSVAHAWVLSAHDLYIIGTGYDSTGNKVGALIPARHLFLNGDLDYYEADIPETANFLSTFGLADVAGSGNPFQLITLSVTSHIDPPSSEPKSSDDSTPGTGANTGKATAPATVQIANPPQAPAPADPGKTEKIYANANGVITQETILRSTDMLATVSIGLGVVAKDLADKPLSSVTLTALPPEKLPPLTTSASSTFTGMAYNLEPDGAGFSPTIFFSFSYPKAQWGEEYTVKMFDRQHGTWQDLPTTYDASTGLITAQLSHFCCFALFAKPKANSSLSAKENTDQLPKAAPPVTPAPPPGTALNTFIGMATWVTDLVIKNVYIFLIVVVLLIAYGVRKRRYPGSGW
jgi:beta propeller repeat protein